MHLLHLPLGKETNKCDLLSISMDFKRNKSTSLHMTLNYNERMLLPILKQQFPFWNRYCTFDCSVDESPFGKRPSSCTTWFFRLHQWNIEGNPVVLSYRKIKRSNYLFLFFVFLIWITVNYTKIGSATREHCNFDVPWTSHWYVASKTEQEFNIKRRRDVKIHWNRL